MDSGWIIGLFLRLSGGFAFLSSQMEGETASKPTYIIAKLDADIKSTTLVKLAL